MTTPPRPHAPARPFADSVLAYAQAGWQCIMPVPIDKHPPPVGFTGADGRDTDPMQLATWAGTHPAHSIALRLPDGVIGIDVDQYAKGSVDKQGADTLAAAVERFGPLPATWTSTARGPGQPSRIHFFRAPAQRYATKLGPDVEIIQRHHRYAVVWPSPHPEAADIYRWYDPAGAIVEQPPKPGELPELPQAWVEGLREGATDAAPASADHASGEAMLASLLADERPGCAELAGATTHALDEVARADAGSRHDTMTARAHQLVQLGAAGHPGVGTALLLFRLRWAELTAGEDREAEFDRMLLTSARKAVTVVGPRPVTNDPCTLVGSIPVAQPAAGGPAPDDDRKGHDAPEPIEQPRDLHPQEVLGGALFMPKAQLDQRLADAVLERMWPLLRYGYDEGVWLLRERVSWAARPDLAEWAIAQAADMMPRGNPDAEKGSEDRDAAERRKRLMSAGPAGAIAKKMRARVAGGAHPCALRVAELDTEPWLLWAGGVGWDLTASRVDPARADIDPATPHLRSAAVAPEHRPTPLWDAFVAAVWPDEELRRWALRVLSIACTGYADRALPILVGEGGRGKTQVITLLMSVLGSYAHAGDPRLLNGLDNAHASIIYALKGRRLSFIDEGPREGRVGQERLKQLTGGGDLTGNQMNRNPITFTPTHTLVLTSNDEPMLTDPAIRDRVRFIPCEGDPGAVRATRRAIGHTSSRPWRREAPGVLAALMREAAAWLADPDSALNAAAPEVYQARVAQLAAEQDPVRTWTEEETEAHAPGTRSRELYEAFVGWAKNGNTHPGRIPSETKWGKQITDLGYAIEKRRDGNYRPLRLKPRMPWSQGPTVVISSQAPEPTTSPAPSAPTGAPAPSLLPAVATTPTVSHGEIRGGLVEGCGGFAEQPSTLAEPVNTGAVSTSEDLVEGVEGRSCIPNTRAHDARAHEGQPETPSNPPLPSTHPQPGEPAGGPAGELPESAKITAKLLAARDTAPQLPPGVIACGPGPITEHDAEAIAEFARDLAERAEPLQLQVFTPDTPAPFQISSRIPAELNAPTESGRPDLSAEFHELKRQQDLRLEAAVRGHLTGRDGRDSEEVLRYFGEGEFEGDRVEQRLTWTRFLEQRRHEKRYEKAQQKAYDTGRKLGFHHGLHSARPATHDEEYDQAQRGLDADAFAHGYQDGVITAVDVAGEPIDLPALVTRDGAVHPVALADVPQLADAFDLLAELTVDVEHTGFPLGHADYALRTIQLGNENVAVVLDADDPEQVQLARDWLVRARMLHAHSATADLIPLAFAGALDDLEAAWARMADTAIPAKLADPTSTGNDADLKKLAVTVLGPRACSPAAEEGRTALFKAGRWLTDIKPLTPPAKSGWAMSDKRSATMIRYAASDVLDDAALARALPPVPPAVLQREHTAQVMTARVSHRGLALDAAKIGELLPQQRAALADAAARLKAFGIENPGSDQQIGAKAVQLGAPLPHTKTGKPSVAKGVLDPFKHLDGPLGEFVRARLDYQKAETALGLFLEPWDELLHRGDGRARPTVYTLGADTGRMSCVRPNLQQVPREGGYRACIVADPGELLISADFASVEIRVMAALSGDPTLRQLLLDDVDLHAMIAAQVFGPEWTKGDRYMVKRGVFGWAYGGGIPTLARQVGASESTMASVVDTLAGIAPTYVRWAEDVKAAVKAGHTQFPAYSGRIIHLPGRFPHKAPNYCIQGTAREALVDALMRWRGTRWGTCTLLPVHDEILVAVREDEADAALAELVRCMETDLMGVPIKAEAAKPSRFWADAS